MNHSTLHSNMIFAKEAIREALAFTPDGSDNKGSAKRRRRIGLGPQPIDSAIDVGKGVRTYECDYNSERSAWRQRSHPRPSDMSPDEIHWKKLESLRDIFTSSQVARIFGQGNCHELSALAFVHLYMKRVRPLDFMSFKAWNYDHVWVVIGRESGEAGDLKTWGADAVWCDPWGAPDGLSFPVRDLPYKRPIGTMGGPENYFHYAICTANRRPLSLDMALIEAGKPEVNYRAK